MNDANSIQDAARLGTSGPSEPLPFLHAIQSFFGRHDVSQVRAHLDPNAAAGSASMGANAFATGNDVAFGGFPTLRTAAHEAAHVVQQREGAQIDGGIGRAGDEHERAANAVADRVIQGRSSEDLLPKPADPVQNGRRAPAIQRDTPDKPHAEQKVTFLITFDRNLTKAEFIDLTEKTIYGPQGDQPRLVERQGAIHAQ